MRIKHIGHSAIMSQPPKANKGNCPMDSSITEHIVSSVKNFVTFMTTDGKPKSKTKK